MKGLRHAIILIIIFYSFQSCLKEELVFNAESNRELKLPTILKINNKECCFDHTENNLRYSLEIDLFNDFKPLIEFQDYSVIYFEGALLKNNSINNLGKIEINKEYEVVIKANNETKKLQLTFTNLPIVQIITPNKIYDDPKTLARLIINHQEKNKLSESYFIGLEHRGGASQSFEKKSMGFSLKNSLDLDDDSSDQLFEMKKNNDWILDAMWIDQGRLRNKSSFELWTKLDGDRHDGIEGEFVELFINNEHQGLYCLNENINSEKLELNNDDDAVLYKATEWGGGATLFDIYADDAPVNYYWDGWEQKYPDPKTKINWSPLKELRQTIVDGTDTEFKSNIASLIDIDNLVDYYIFLNLVSAGDNRGKNTFLVKKDKQSKFYYIPWDIDGSWGLLWNGTRVGYTSILSNNLFDRLIATDADNFKNKLKLRWNALRSDLYSNSKLKDLFTANFNLINQSDIIEIENRKWGSNIDLSSDQVYLNGWIDNRVIFLDNYFKNL